MPWAKTAVGTLVVLAIPFFVAGPIAGAVCLFIALCVALVAWTPLGPWLGLHQSGSSSEPTALKTLDPPGPCGDPTDRRNRIRDHAKHLKSELDNFGKYWWSAIEDKSFDGKLPGGAMRTTHDEAMVALLWVFAKFFSAVRTYEVQCFRLARPEESLMKRVRGVYDALGLNGGGDTDETVDSMKLQDLGELSTWHWKTEEAQPFTKVELEAAMNADPRLDRSVVPIRRLLLAAGPGTEARSRLNKTALALGRVSEESDQESGASHGVLVEDSEDVLVEDNDISGFDSGVTHRRSKGGVTRGNRISEHRARPRRWLDAMARRAAWRDARLDLMRRAPAEFYLIHTGRPTP